jgi:peptidoglycan/xylan/chitin deacetylase (PgdA/CDA1 family)
MAKAVFSHPNSLKIALAAGVFGLAVFIGGGAWYIEHNPALSLPAVLATIERPILSFRYAGLAEAAPQSESKAVGIPILTYHRIVSDSSDVSNVTDSRFEDQMVTLKKAGWNAVSLEDFEQFMRGKKELPEKSFLLTFDDGAKDSFYPVDPILNVLNYHGVNFVIVASSETKNTTYYLTPLEIDRMIKNGRWSIGSHSYDGHRPYSTDSATGTGIFFADRLWKHDQGRLETPEEYALRVGDDLAKAKAELELDYGTTINSFAFPLGNETGINGANNYPEGSQMTAAIARTIYGFGFVQTNNQQFTANFPQPQVGTSSTPWPTDPFLMHRVHVDYDWDGARVLEIFENSLAKPFPFEDDFDTDKGWIPAWGNVELGRNNFTLSSLPETTSASTFLDGTAMWDNYSFDASVTWNAGNAIVLGDVVNSSTYHSCVFKEGEVRIQRTINGKSETLAQKSDPRIAYGDTRIGIRVHNSTIECTWNFASILATESRDFKGGIGLQTWDETPGTANLRISSIIVRPYGE